MKKFGVLTALLVGLVFGGSASASNLPPVFNWTGFYVGAHAGYAKSEDPFGGSVSGPAGGFQLGHNSQFSNIVVGLEGDFTSGDISNGAGSRIEYFATVRGRVGLAIDRVLIYATAGFLWADITRAFGPDGVSTGTVTGAGVEWMFAHQWSMKFEYLVGDFEGVLDLETIKVGVNYRF